MSTCLQIDPADNTAVLLDDAQQGDTLTVLGNASRQIVKLNEAINYAHKVALVNILQGADVFKYGISIGQATQDINAGDWIHLHNLASDYDERSSTLDLHSGLSTDMIYE